MDNKITNIKNFKIQNLPTYDNHYLIINFNKPKINLKGFIAIHREKFPALGATRFKNYKNDLDALQDALNLSKLMTYKCLLAKIPHSGAKAIILNDKNVKKNRKFLFSYAEIVNKLNGIFITGADMGITLKDIATLRKKTPYVVDENFDKYGGPPYWTALGVYYSMLAGLQFIYQENSLQNKTIAIQGVGKVGLALLKLLLKDGAKIIISDVNNENLIKIKKLLPSVKIVKPEYIYHQKVDIFSPCGPGYILNKKTVHHLKCKIICGAANNQLADDKIDEIIYRKNIIYLPDYLVNAGGVIFVSELINKQKFSYSKIIKKIRLIKKRTLFILEKSKLLKKSPYYITQNFITNLLRKHELQH